MAHRTTQLMAAYWAGGMAERAGASWQSNPYRRRGTLAPAPNTPPVDVACARMWRSGFDRSRSRRS